MSSNFFTSSIASWQEDIIYFLMVDRFHDGRDRKSIKSEGRLRGFGNSEELRKSCGGTLKGVTTKLPYIKELGCTSIWLSPVFENNPESYHGYDIRNFLAVDPRFGTLEDLINLVSKAHELGLKIYLDAVINHSGNNWSYKGKENKDFFYQREMTYEFGQWRYEEFPIPLSLRNPDYYYRKGMIRNWDNYPETRLGDFFSLKKFRLDDSQSGTELQDILVEIYSYWIKVTNCDGFRIDAAKHAGETAVNRFSARVKEFALESGKKDFFIFAEVPASDPYAALFLNTGVNTAAENSGPDTVFDFPLHFVIKKIIMGKLSPEVLKKRLRSREKYFQSKDQTLIPLVNFLDNHDQIESPMKKRIAADLSDKQLLAALGLLFSLPGIPCIYYGTEQGLDGEGDSDGCIRECMFDFKNPEGMDCFNQHSQGYSAISRLAELRKSNPAMSGGVIAWPALFIKMKEVRSLPLVFTREWDKTKILIAYNSSYNEKCEFFVEFSNAGLQDDMPPEIIFSNFETGNEGVLSRGESRFQLKIVLSPEQFIILK